EIEQLCPRLNHCEKPDQAIGLYSQILQVKRNHHDADQGHIDLADIVDEYVAPEGAWLGHPSCVLLVLSTCTATRRTLSKGTCSAPCTHEIYACGQLWI